MNVTAHHSLIHLFLPSTQLPAAAAADDDDEKDVVRYGRQRRHEDDTLYIILGVIVGAVLIGVLVSLFVCARQQHKQRLLIGSAPHVLLMLF